MKSLREKRKEELKRKIFETSMRLFAERGYENTTISQIAEACNIAKGTFFNYFPKKEAILNYYGVMNFHWVNELTEELMDKQLPADLILDQVFHKLLDKSQENPNITRMLIMETMQSSAVLQEYNNQEPYTDLIGRVLQYGQSQGIFKKDWCLPEVAENIFFLYMFTCVQWANQRADNIYERWQRTLTSYFKGLKAKQ